MSITKRNFLQGTLGMGLLDLLGVRPAAAKAPAPQPAPSATPATPAWPQGAVAQLVGANLSTPLNDQGYQLDYHLPKFLDAGPNGKTPEVYRSQTTEGHSRLTFDEDLNVNLTLGTMSFVVSYHGRDVEGFNLFMWKGVRMNGLPVVAGFTESRTDAEAQRIWETAYRQFGLTSKPVLTVASGKSGWTTFDTALTRIAQPEDKVIWLSSVDSPSFPKPNEPNGAAVLLMLAHPGYDTGRKPLVYFTAPVVVPVVDAKPQDKAEPKRTAALRESVERACQAAGIAPQAIGSVATDCGRHTPPAAKRLSEVAAALTGLVPEVDMLNERIDMAALLGELGANTVNLSLLLAAFAAHTRNHPVLYVSDVDPLAARALLVLPPAHHTPPDPKRTFREARAIGQWYSPWWGQRLDGKLDP